MTTDFINSKLDGYALDDLKSSDVRYLKNFWISIDELSTVWGAVLSGAFSQTSGVVSINAPYSVNRKMGGVLFDESEFDRFKLDAEVSGATRFAVIEDIGQESWQTFNDPAFFRFTYPIDITWNEMALSCALAEDVFLRPIRCFFVVLENWHGGKYVNSDAEAPYELIFTAAAKSL